MKKEVDSETLKGLKEGKISSFESIYQYYSGRVYNFINSIVKDRILSKDLTQDVFMQIWDKRRGILCDGNFDSYIFTIARNRVYHYIKREMWIQQYFEAEAKEQSLEEKDDADHELDNLLLEEYILKLIRELPESRRHIFMMYWKEELNYMEIARQLSISEKTVATQVQRSLQFLRSKMRYVALGLLLMSVVCDTFFEVLDRVF